MKKSIKVFAPATVSNMGCGFDLLGFAMYEPGDEIIVHFDKSGTDEIVISKITGDNGKLPLEIEKNTAGVAVLKMKQALSLSGKIEIEIHKKMPFGSGLGSSAASACGAVFALSQLIPNNLSKKELLPFALEGEKIVCGSIHVDNVGPCLLGGITLIQSIEPLEVINLDFPENIFSLVLYPHLNISTQKSRKLIQKKITFSQHVQQSRYLAGLIHGITSKNIDMISASIKDCIIEPIRSLLIPFYRDITQIIYKNKAIGCNISGSGPSIFALAKSIKEAENIKEELAAFFKEKSLGFDIYISPINKEGVKIIE